MKTIRELHAEAFAANEMVNEVQLALFDTRELARQLSEEVFVRAGMAWKEREGARITSDGVFSQQLRETYGWDTNNYTLEDLERMEEEERS